MAIAGLLGAGLRSIGGGLVKGAAKGAATNFIKGKRKKINRTSGERGRVGQKSSDGKGGALVRQTPIVSSTPLFNPGAIVPISGAAKSGTSGEKLVVIKTKVIEVDKLLKGSVVTEKKQIEKENREKQKAARGQKEDKLESDISRKEKKEGGIKAPKLSFLDRMKNFIKNIILGFIIVRLIEFAPLLKKILPLIGLAADLVSKVVVGIVDGLGTFLSWGFKAYDDAKAKLKEWGGDSAVARLEELGDSLGNLFNAISIVGMATATMGPKGTKNLLRREAGLKPPKPTTPPTTPRPGTSPTGRPGMSPTGPQGASRAMQKLHGPEARAIYDNARENGKTVSQAKAAVNRALRNGDIISKPQKGTLNLKTGGTPKGNVMKGGLKKAPKKLATKLLGKAGMKAVKGIFGKIPILGPIVVAVASLLAGEPIGQALFKAVGAALGGFLGTFIPIPVIGTMLGETLGTFVGDLLYSLILGGGPKEAGEKLSKAIKTALDVGGLIVDFFKNGVGNFLNQFFEKDALTIPKGFPFRRTAATKIVEFLNMKDYLRKRGYVNDEDQIYKFPNLMNILNPITYVQLLASSFFPDLFGKVTPPPPGAPGKISDAGGAGERNKGDNTGGNNNIGGGGPSTPSRPANVEGMEASKKGKIYLHWSAGGGMTAHPSRYHTTVLADGSKVQETPYSQFRTPGGHTAYRNSQGVGLAIAAMQDWNWSTIKPVQLDALTSEAATVAKQMGYTKGMVNVRNIATHAEVGSMRDGQKNPPYSGNTKHRPPAPDNHGPAWPGWGGDGARSDFVDINQADYNAQKGIGGDKLRSMIKAKMRMGGPTMGRGLYEMGEEGKEYVIDADSTRALQGTFPGLLRALNKAKGDEAIDVLRSYADYEMAEVVPVVITKPVPVPSQTGMSKKSFNKPVMVSSGVSGSFQDTLYKGG